MLLSLNEGIKCAATDLEWQISDGDYRGRRRRPRGSLAVDGYRPARSQGRPGLAGVPTALDNWRSWLGNPGSVETDKVRYQALQVTPRRLLLRPAYKRLLKLFSLQVPLF